MPKHIGIVAVSAEGAALCYRTICKEGSELMGEHAHPEISMHTYPLNQYMQPIYDDNWQGVADLMLASAKKLDNVGVDFLICPDNTVHEAFDLMIEKSPLPWLHIAVEVASAAANRGYKCLGVLGTRYLMEGSVYPPKLNAVGVRHDIPQSQDRQRINDIIFNELVYGRFEEKARSYFQEVIVKLKEKGCDAVVLGCTEIPLLISEADSPLPILDSTRLLARAALNKATHENIRI